MLMVRTEVVRVRGEEILDNGAWKLGRGGQAVTFLSDFPVIHVAIFLLKIYNFKSCSLGGQGSDL